MEKELEIIMKTAVQQMSAGVYDKKYQLAYENCIRFMDAYFKFIEETK